ncbi:MAG: GNAT family N-acetyltransferase [Chloroflexi bacterium]|nr:GNAT family N-acetyltransferase [Chloroflexota bacterium]
MQPPFLTSEQLYLRAMVAEDKEVAVAWRTSPLPLNAARAEGVLREAHQTAGWRRPAFLFAIVQRETDAVIGSVTVMQRQWRAVLLRLHLAPWLNDADAWRAETLRLVTPWLRDEGEVMVISVFIDADQPVTLAAAAELGMVEMAWLRERVARPGGRADQALYQALNPRWEVVAHA